MAIRNFEREDLPFLNYELEEEQEHFTRSAKWCIEEKRIESDASQKPIVILHNDLPVGFFILDEGEGKFDYTKNKNSVLIRSLSLNPEFQGKGIAKQAMLDISEYVKKNFTDIDELVLAVNFRNKNAYNLYLKCNFQDFGDVTEGRNGPQHILLKKI